MEKTNNSLQENELFKCICCGKETSHICASSIAPVSNAYCENCQENNAEPWVIVKYIGKQNNWNLPNDFLERVTIFEDGKYKSVKAKIIEMGIKVKEVKSRMDFDS